MDLTAPDMLLFFYGEKGLPGVKEWGMRSGIKRDSEKAKPVEKRGRKATGLQKKIAGLPEKAARLFFMA
jgi:hypothetical protein